MGRKIAQIIFIAIGLIFTFLAYVIGYNSGASTNYFDLMTNAAKADDHSELCKAFSMYQIPYDSNSTFEVNHGNDNNIAIYNAVNQLNLEYFEKTEDSTKDKKYSKVQYMYYFFVFNPKFDYGSIDGINKTGLKFYGAGEETYTFHYVVNSTTNSDEYKSQVLSPTEALFNSERNMVTTYSQYGFVFTSLSDLFLSEIRTKVGGEITKFELLDNKGNSVCDPIELKLDFTENFFVDLKDFKNASADVNEIDQIPEGERNNEQKEAYENAQNYLNSFKIEDYQDKGYLPGYAKDDIYTTKLIWSSIGIAAIFFVIVALVYILVFYFKNIKNWVFGGHRRNNTRIVPNKIPNKPNTTPERKTNFDRLNEKRAEDLAKKRAKEEEIRKRGNMIALAQNKPEEDNNQADLEPKAVEAEDVSNDTVLNNDIEETKGETLDSNADNNQNE